MMELERNAPATVEMTNEEWQTVLAILREAPYKVVAPLIDKIVSQCITQAIPKHADTAIEP